MLRNKTWLFLRSMYFSAAKRHGLEGSACAVREAAVVPRPPHMDIIHFIYVFTIKSNGHKVYVVALGSLQFAGFYYDATFATVVTFASVRLLCTTVALQGLDVHHTDVVTAFLHGEADMDIFISPPAGTLDPRNPHFVWEPSKALMVSKFG